jgi:hypothetical protein
MLHLIYIIIQHKTWLRQTVFPLYFMLSSSQRDFSTQGLSEVPRSGVNTFSYDSTSCGVFDREHSVPEFYMAAFDTYVLVDPICVTFKQHKDAHA